MNVTGEQKNLVSKAVRSIYPPLIWLSLFMVIIVWSYDLDEISRAAPLLTGYTGLILGLLDLVSRFEGSAGEAIRVSMGAGFNHPEISHNPILNAELIQIGWMAIFVLMSLFIGILPAVPIYVLASMRFNGKCSWKESLIAAAGTVAFVFVVFEVFLAFELYRGVWFDERGFDRW